MSSPAVAQWRILAPHTTQLSCFTVAVTHGDCRFTTNCSSRMTCLSPWSPVGPNIKQAPQQNFHCCVTRTRLVRGNGSLLASQFVPWANVPQYFQFIVQTVSQPRKIPTAYALSNIYIYIHSWHYIAFVTSNTLGDRLLIAAIQSRDWVVRSFPWHLEGPGLDSRLKSDCPYRNLLFSAYKFFL